VIGLDGETLAGMAGATVARRSESGGPRRAVLDTRELEAGDLFFALRGEQADGGEFAAEALASGAWGVVVDSDRATKLAAVESGGWILSAPDPLRALQTLAKAFRAELGCPVVGITGSTGKTSVKDICRTLLGDRVHTSPGNYNTEIGLPLAILAVPPDAQVVVLEMAMRGEGQIRELTEIAEPDVGLITNVGPVHVELLGSLAAIAATKAELFAGLRDGGTAIAPVEAGELEAHLHDDQRTLRFGPGGDVFAAETKIGERETEALVSTPAGEQDFSFPFDEAHNLDNALAAIATGVALEIPLDEMARRTPGIVFSRLHGELVPLKDDSILINDCYNANPLSMRAALDHLGSHRVAGRRLAVLGEMRELGPDAPTYHREVGEHARRVGVEEMIGVGPLASEYAPDVLVDDAPAAAEALEERLGTGDAVLVKGSRAVGLEVVAERLGKEDEPDAR
jgi:UDP-N-acetylmuramoyl-tripeptide--D-alanyl-D-alanine ligase